MLCDKKEKNSNSLGLVRYDEHNFPAAKQHFDMSLAIARRINDKAAIAVCLNNLTMLAVEMKQFNEAEQFDREALDLNRANHDRQSGLYSLHNSAAIARGRGDFKEAEALLADVIRESRNDIWLRWMGQVDLANAYSDEKQNEAADREFRTALVTVDQARASVGKEEYRLSFLNTATLFYNSYIDFLVEHGRMEDALRIAEHSRARTLAEGLGLNPSREAATEHSPRWVPSGETNKPRRGDRNPTPTLIPEQICQHTGAVILEYWLKPGQSYLWAVTPYEGLRCSSCPPITEIEAAVQEYRKALLGPQ